MIITIRENEKQNITHALRAAMGRINHTLATAFDNCHPDRHSLNWYRRVESDISVMKELKQLLDRIEGKEQEAEGKEETK